MLTASQLRQSAALSGVRDIASIEIDVVLTHLLQLFREHGLTEHLAFKGGTFLRKMVFGPRGRLSTDLDFTCRSDICLDDLTLWLLETLEQPYQGISFRFDKDKDWYLTEEGCAANPVCAHEANTTGIKIKIQVSMRERPILPVQEAIQIEQSYFKFLAFAPSSIPSLTVEEVIAEKIRAASQRSKIRDLYDLAEISRRPLNKELVRSLAVLKLWQSSRSGLDYGRFRERIENGDEYDVRELQNLVRRDQNPDPFRHDCSGLLRISVSRSIDRCRTSTGKRFEPSPSQRGRNAPKRNCPVVNTTTLGLLWKQQREISRQIVARGQQFVIYEAI